MVIFLLFWGILGMIFTLISYLFDKKNICESRNRTLFIVLFFLISWFGVLLYWVGPFFISIITYKLNNNGVDILDL